MTACGRYARDGTAAGVEAVTSRAELGLHDVSVLYPLPETSADEDLLLEATTTGARGELLPESVYSRIPPLVGGGAARTELRVVSFRVDPCFPGAGASACKNQLRLIFQPLAEASDGALQAEDAALHAFYALSREELVALLDKIREARGDGATTGDEALGVHPVLAAQTLRGAFAEALRTLVPKYAGSTNLTRATFMTREASRQGRWMFGGFDLKDGEATPMRIASLTAVERQTFTTLMRNGGVTPALETPDDITVLFKASSADAAPAADLAKAYSATLKIQNPDIHSPDTIDCVSCHTATSARLWVEDQKGQRPEGDPAAFETKYAVSLAGSPIAARPDNLHAFSYLGRDPGISQRTANETAAVLAYVTANLR